jgi:hypothetical protein
MDWKARDSVITFFKFTREIGNLAIVYCPARNGLPRSGLRRMRINMMRAIVAKGPPGGVKVALKPIPKASPGNLLVRVRAAACQDGRFSQFVFTANLLHF